jgi:protein-tyrosine phosphatase
MVVRLATLVGTALVLVSLTTRLVAQGPAGTSAVAPAVPGQSLGLASVPNLRDVGGYTTHEGAVVRRGVLYRANQLRGLSAADMQQLAALGLKNNFDLRTGGERDAKPDELPPGVRTVWLNVLADAKGVSTAEIERLLHDPPRANSVLGRGKAEAGMRQAYRDFVSLPSAKAALHQLYATLGERGSTPALFHCTTGKDRTGWAAAALLTLLGVPQDTVLQDYLRSNDYILPYYQKAIDAFVAAGGEPGIPAALLGVKVEYLEASFDEMQNTYGTMERYFAEGLGIDAAQQQALREVLLETK